MARITSHVAQTLRDVGYTDDEIEGLSDSQITRYTEGLARRTTVAPYTGFNRQQYPFQGRVMYQGIPVALENLAGTMREGVDLDGKPWRALVPVHYGEIHGMDAESSDGDRWDCCVGDLADAPNAYTVRQLHPTGEFDEPKTYFGFESPGAVRTVYHSAFADGSGTQRMGGMMAHTVAEFREILSDPEKRGALLEQLRSGDFTSALPAPSAPTPGGSGMAAPMAMGEAAMTSASFAPSTPQDLEGATRRMSPDGDDDDATRRMSPDDSPRQLTFDDLRKGNVPTDAMKSAVRRAFLLRAAGKPGMISDSEAKSQGIHSGLEMARAIRSGRALTDEEILRGDRFHKRFKSAGKVDPGKKPEDDAGRNAVLGWGGPSAASWFRERADAIRKERAEKGDPIHEASETPEEEAAEHLSKGVEYPYPVLKPGEPTVKTLREILRDRLNSSLTAGQGGEPTAETMAAAARAQAMEQTASQPFTVDPMEGASGDTGTRKTTEARLRSLDGLPGEISYSGPDVLGSTPDAIFKGEWSAAKMNDLPDSAFLYIEAGGKKDESGRTVPRSLRHFPYRNDSGKVDLPHLRNALARIPQSNVSESVKRDVTKRAQRLLKSSQE